MNPSSVQSSDDLATAAASIPPRPFGFLAAIVMSALVVCPARAPAAEGAAPDEGAADSKEVVADVKAYFTAPLHWQSRDWLELAGGLAAVGVAYQKDEDVRGHFVSGPDSGLDSDDRHDLHDALPAVVALGGTWLYAAVIDDEVDYREPASMLEAAVLSSTTAYILKQVAGRERPDESADHSGWRNGSDAFPSLHVTAAFAIGTVLAESGNDRYRWIRRTLGYGLAAGTAYERLDHNAHWLSDTVAGAGLGLATARFVMNRRDRPDEQARILLLPMDGGLMLTYSAPLSR